MKKTLSISVIVLLVSCLAVNLVAQEETGAGEVVEGMEFSKDTDLINLLWKDAGAGFEAETIDVGGGAVYDKADDGNNVIKLDGGKSYLDYEGKDGNGMILNNFKGDVEFDENGGIVKTTGDVESGVSELAMNFKLEDSMGNEYDTPVNVPEGTNVDYDNGELTLKCDKPFSVCQGGKTCDDVDVSPVGAQDVTMNMGDDGKAIDLSCKGGCDLKIDDYNFETVDAAKGGEITISDAKNDIYDITEGSVSEGGCSELSCGNGFSVSTKEGSTEPLEVGLKGCDGMGADSFVCLNPGRDQGGFSGEFELENSNFKMSNGDGTTGDFFTTEGGNVIRFDDMSSLGGETNILTNGKEVTLTDEYTFLDDPPGMGGEFVSDEPTTIVNPSEEGKFDVAEVSPDGVTEYSIDCEASVLSWLGAAVVDITGAQTTPKTNPAAPCPAKTVVDPTIKSDDQPVTLTDKEIREMLDPLKTPVGELYRAKYSVKWDELTPQQREEEFKILEEDYKKKFGKTFSPETKKRILEIFDKEYRITGAKLWTLKKIGKLGDLILPTSDR